LLLVVSSHTPYIPHQPVETLVPFTAHPNFSAACQSVEPWQVW
jgi:hypothetical protein